MKKRSTVCTVLLGILIAIMVFAGVGWMTYAQGLAEFTIPGASQATPHPPSAAPQVTDSQFTVVCHATQSLPVNGFDAPPKVFTETLLGNLDFDNKTGWYQGQFAISESRKGSLTQEGSMVRVSRPALFERFGAMVTGEQFTIERTTGEFLQSLTLKDGRIFDLIKGYCGKLIKAPF